jgi:hypothetical protein
MQPLRLYSLATVKFISDYCWKDLAVYITTVLETDNYKGFGGRVSRDYRANTPPRPANSAKERKRCMYISSKPH